MEKIYYEVFQDMGEREGSITIMRCNTFQEAQDYKVKAEGKGLFEHPLKINKWRTMEGAGSEFLGEGDPQPLCICDICGEELYDGDKAYGTTDGSVMSDYCGFIQDTTEPWNTIACSSCGERISEKICDLYKRPAQPASDGHSEGKLELGGESAMALGCVTIYANGEPIAHVEEWAADGDEKLKRESEANARRFVALWNACLNISTSALENDVIEEMAKIIKTTLEDCEMALSGEWDKGNQGFEAMAEAARKILGKLGAT
jgi:hypothetical protein